MITDPATRLILRQDVLRQGGTDHDLRRGERHGELSRVHRGFYAAPDELATLDEVRRHRVSVMAAAALSPVSVATHASAAALWDLPMYRADLRRVHFTRPGSTSGRIRASRVDHAGALPNRDIVVVDGVRTSSTARTLVDLARSLARESAVVPADAALHRGQVDRAELDDLLARCRGLPGINSGRAALALVDGRSESPGESLTRLALGGLGSLDSQVTITDAAGRFVGRADFGIRDAVLLVEFDGRQKYLQLRAPGQSIEDAVLAEKRREDALRGLGYLVARVVWSDLTDRAALRARITAAISRGRGLHDRGFRAIGDYRPMVDPSR